jgi:type II secretory pathway component PulM
MSLNQRERTLLIVAIIILLPLLVFRFVLLPIKQHQDNLTTRIKTISRSIEQADLLGQELLFLRNVTRTNPVSLSKRVDSVLRQENLKARSRIALEEQPNGGQRLVLKLDEINLTELTTIIYQIENSKPVVMIDNIDIAASFKNKKLFRVSIALISN